MKAVKEAAEHNTSIEVNKGADNDALFINRVGMKQLLDRTFELGVEFAQRWIPIEEELPSEENEFLNVPVIAITGYGNYRITVYDGFNWTSDEIVTFWRPIELK